MKGLRKYLTPFAPDQSGAVSVLYELGGMLVICDAGGCTGNVCGFDEPRWFETRSAVFSAGLRDMDAILGRDDRLVAKLADAAEKLDVTFAAVIGTPVPAVIGTDYRALERMLAKKTELPVLTVNTDGMELYDRGEEKAYLVLFGRFAGENVDVEPGNIEKTQTAESCDGKRNGKNEDVSVDIEDRPRVGIIGMTPQDVSDLKAAEKIRKLYADQGLRAVCYGMGDGLDEVRNASLAAKNVVVSPAALKAAQYLQKKFGTPYEIAYPLVSELVPEVNYQGKKILIVQQQVIANAVRKEIEKRTGEKETITTATWFMRKEEILTDLNVDAVDDSHRPGQFQQPGADEADDHYCGCRAALEHCRHGQPCEDAQQRRGRQPGQQPLHGVARRPLQGAAHPVHPVEEHRQPAEQRKEHLHPLLHPHTPLSVSV